MKIQLDMYQTMAVAVAVLMLGSYLRKKIDILERFCIPAPVVGGFLFAIFTCICYATGILEFEFDDILKEVCMVFFFTSVGFQANLKVLKKGWKVFDSISWACDRAYIYAEFCGSRTFKIIRSQLTYRNVYRFHTYGRWAWYSRCIWSCT